MRKCVDCGQEAEDNLDFCLNCGANLPKIIIEPKSPPSTTPSIQGPITTYTLDPRRNVTQSPQNRQPSQPPKTGESKDNWIVICCCLSLLVLFLLGMGSK